MDSNASGFPAGARPSLVLRRRGACLQTAYVLRVVVPLRRIRSGHFHRRRRLGHGGQCHGRCRCDCRLSASRATVSAGHDLWLSALGDRTGGAQGGVAGAGRNLSRPPRPAVPPARRSRARAVLCADAQRQRRRPGRADTALVAFFRGRARHKGRELDLDGRLAVAVLALPAVRSDGRALGGVQPASRGPARPRGGTRRPEYCGCSGRPRRLDRTAQPLGKDEPLTTRRRHPPRPLRGRGQDIGGRCDLPLRSLPSDREHAPA
jgi:hypothetical protein